jgi:hypothetical protein
MLRMRDNDYDDNISNKNSVIYLFRCLLSSPNASYKVNTAEEETKQTHRNRRQNKETCKILKIITMRLVDSL